MAMRIATWAWFSPRARVPRGAPCIFGSIQQARVNAYAPDILFWSQGCFQRAVLVGGQTPLEQMGILRAVPDHKLSSSSAILPDCSGAGGACVAEYSVFCTARAGGTSGSGRTSQPFYAICNGKYAKHQEIALLVSKLSAGQQHLRPAPKSNRAGTLMADPHQNANAARALSQKGCPSRA